MRVWHSFRFLRHRTKTVLGIDITSTAVKLLELSKIGNQYCVMNYARRPLPDKAMDAGIINDVQEIANCVRSLLKDIKPSNRYAILAVPDASTMSKIIQVSELLREEDIEELVLIEVDKHIPYPIGEINYDFSLLGPSLGQTGMRDLLIVASRSEYINQRVESLRLAGLKTQTIDIESHAILRVLRFMASCSDLFDKKIIMLIDIGSAYTNMFVMHDKTIIFVHTESFGGDKLLSHTVKCIADSDKMFPIDDSDTYGLEISIAQFREQMLSHIKRSLQFFYSSHQMKQIDYIILAGGVAKQNGLVEFLETNLHIPTKRVNPFENMLFAKKANKEAIMCDFTMLMTAFGLALRS